MAKIIDFEKIKYTISHKPVGTLVNCYDKEIRVMCPKDTKWTTQQSGETADKMQDRTRKAGP